MNGKAVGQLTAFSIGGNMVTGTISVGWSVFIFISCLAGVVIQLVYFARCRNTGKWVKFMLAMALAFVALEYAHILFSRSHNITIEMIRMVVIVLVYSLITAGIVGIARLKYE